MTVKRRLSYQGSGRYRNSGFVPWTNFTYSYYDTVDIQLSVEHPAWRRKVDGGGPFLMTKTSYQVSPGVVSTGRLEGPWLPAEIGSRAGNFGIPTFESNSNMVAKGTTAIARSLPTNPASQLSTALGELGKDGLPQVIGSAAFKDQVHAAKRAGNEYLNYEFGWLPLVSDLRKFAHAVKHRDEIMSGYIKYSDKQIRRRYDYPSASGVQNAAGSGYARALSTDHLYTSNQTDTFSVANWFSGAFRYHVPTGTGFNEKAAYYRSQASKILGLELTPEVVWNLAPWSWAADWFGNTGDVLHNISRLGQDGLVMRYGYMMTHKVSTRNVYATGAPSGVLKGSTASFTVTNETKQRIPSSPYGFGLTFDGFTNTQKAVVAALGLTRAFK